MRCLNFSCKSTASDWVLTSVKINDRLHVKSLKDASGGVNRKKDIIIKRIPCGALLLLLLLLLLLCSNKKREKLRVKDAKIKRKLNKIEKKY